MRGRSTSEYFYEHPDEYKPELCEALLSEAPKEILLKYPSFLPVLGHQALTNGQYGKQRS